MAFDVKMSNLMMLADEQKSTKNTLAQEVSHTGVHFIELNTQLTHPMPPILSSHSVLESSSQRNRR